MSKPEGVSQEAWDKAYAFLSETKTSRPIEGLDFVIIQEAMARCMSDLRRYADEWRDISSAPKNRTPILLMSPEGDVGIGYLELTGYDDLKFTSGSAAWCGTRKYDHRASVWLGGVKAEDATHWMPLPQPPEPSP